MFELSANTRFEGLFRWALAGALFVGVLVGILMPRVTAQAQETQPQTYTILAGGTAEFNTAVLAFAPQALQVHRGDTVQWVNPSFHNIHFAESLTELIIEAEVDGQPTLQANPAVMFSSIENGAVYQGGDANSGVSFYSENPSTTFSLIMDLEPGTYTYFCDIHPGMAGTITVEDDATPIPSPAEALEVGVSQLTILGSNGVQAAMEAAMQPPMMTDEDTLAVTAGTQSGMAAVLSFFPSAAVIEAGQSVTWTVPAGAEPHTVTWPPLAPGSEFDVIPQDAGPPVIAVNANAFPSIESGSEIGASGSFNSGVMFPVQSFTLTFTEPGVYNYICFLHPGMQAAILVMPQTE